MAKGDVCKVEGCKSLVTTKRGTLCNVHRYRWEVYKSVDKPVFEKPIFPDGVIKICKHHGELKKAQTYTAPNKKTLCCILCRRKQGIAYQERNPAQRMFYSNDNTRKLRKKYQMTKEQYDLMFKNQKGLCAICGLSETKIDKNSTTGNPVKLCVDHCHKQEKEGVIKIRGLLCFKCNMGIAHLDENIETLNSAIKYLIAHQ